MVRRRSASPRPSAPVRSARSSPVPSRAAPTAGASGTTTAPPPSGGGGFMSQMAATAGGVAIGSTVGHALGNMFSGGRDAEPAAAAVPYEGEQGPPQKQLTTPCEFEWQQFLECAQRQSDVGVCQSFNDIFKNCQARFGSR